MTEHRARVDELLAGYRRGRERLAAVHGELAAISASETGADGLVTATVGPRGTLTGLEIAEDAYRRLRPKELAEAIVRVAASATVKALREAGDVLAPSLPAGTDPHALLLGTADLEASEIVRPQATDDEENLENKSWLEEL
ncbi:YbaB/EbfC family nucleoid-associated protein [Amycolatopsis sp. CA-230715]|uniref:YbaB/EbfC family nucleoid-associated protein n=1 Tax=Amycolatopsis sp. CA-230715 TaxID=2745196 RepID=UPI001C026C12|nr:YbaB/EbfC family nucleoid-associated protein [Amycolatopsis sp. CA-230715]QWF79312.1 hypothetical protein HUW46_02719 [Amycolatopsis sp. CA-230715]